MSADKNYHRIEQLVRESHKATTTRELHVIANKLQDLGAWDEAREVRRKARGLEKKLAEVN